MKASSQLTCLLPTLASASTALAQSGGPYSLTWNTLDGGGVTFAAAGAYRLGGTSGQLDAGLLTAGGYTLGGGFWGQGTGSTVDAGPVESVPRVFAARPAAPNPFLSSMTQDDRSVAKRFTVLSQARHAALVGITLFQEGP